MHQSRISLRRHQVVSPVAAHSHPLGAGNGAAAAADVEEGAWPAGPRPLRARFLDILPIVALEGYMTEIQGATYGRSCALLCREARCDPQLQSLLLEGRDNALARAAHTGNAARVEWLLDACGVPVKPMSNTVAAALKAGVMAGQAAATTGLLVRGAHAGEHSCFLMYRAMLHHHHSVVTLLLKHNAVDMAGTTHHLHSRPWYQALVDGHMGLFLRILRLAADQLAAEQQQQQQQGAAADTATARVGILRLVVVDALQSLPSYLGASMLRQYGSCNCAATVVHALAVLLADAASPGAQQALPNGRSVISILLPAVGALLRVQGSLRWMAEPGVLQLLIQLLPRCNDAVDLANLADLLLKHFCVFDERRFSLPESLIVQLPTAANADAMIYVGALPALLRALGTCLADSAKRNSTGPLCNLIRWICTNSAGDMRTAACDGVVMEGLYGLQLLHTLCSVARGEGNPANICGPHLSDAVLPLLHTLLRHCSEATRAPLVRDVVPALLTMLHGRQVLRGATDLPLPEPHMPPDEEHVMATFLPVNAVADVPPMLTVPPQCLWDWHHRRVLSCDSASAAKEIVRQLREVCGNSGSGVPLLARSTVAPDTPPKWTEMLYVLLSCGGVRDLVMSGEAWLAVLIKQHKSHRSRCSTLCDCGFELPALLLENIFSLLLHIASVSPACAAAVNAADGAGLAQAFIGAAVKTGCNLDVAPAISLLDCSVVRPAVALLSSTAEAEAVPSLPRQAAATLQTTLQAIWSLAKLSTSSAGHLRECLRALTTWFPAAAALPDALAVYQRDAVRLCCTVLKADGPNAQLYRLLTVLCSNRATASAIDRQLPHLIALLSEAAHKAATQAESAQASCVADICELLAALAGSLHSPTWARALRQGVAKDLVAMCALHQSKPEVLVCVVDAIASIASAHDGAGLLALRSAKAADAVTQMLQAHVEHGEEVCACLRALIALNLPAAPGGPAGLTAVLECVSHLHASQADIVHACAALQCRGTASAINTSARTSSTASTAAAATAVVRVTRIPAPGPAPRPPAVSSPAPQVARVAPVTPVAAAAAVAAPAAAAERAGTTQRLRAAAMQAASSFRLSQGFRTVISTQPAAEVAPPPPPPARHVLVATTPATVALPPARGGAGGPPLKPPALPTWYR